MVLVPHGTLCILGSHSVPQSTKHFVRRYCHSHGVMQFATKSEDGFMVSGFDNWKKAHERFVKHADSGTHKEALLKIELMKQDGINSSLSKQLQADQKVHRMIKQLTSLRFLAKQGLAIRRNDDMEGNLLQLLQLTTK